MGARVVDSPAILSVTVDWIATATIPAGAIAEETKISLVERPEMHEYVAKNENVAFGLAVPPDAVRGESRLSLSCAEQDGERSWQPIPEVVRWRRREDYGVHMA